MIVTELTARPTSERLIILHFGQAHPRPLWLQIENVEDTLACSFAAGELGLTNKKFLSDGLHLSVLYDGAFYCVDLGRRCLLLTPENDDFVDFIYSRDNSTLCLATFSSLFIFKYLRLVKVITPDTIDGVKFESATMTHVYGTCYDPTIGWLPFKLDLEWLWMETNGTIYRA